MSDIYSKNYNQDTNSVKLDSSKHTSKSNISRNKKIKKICC